MSSRPQSTTSASSACTPPVGVSCWLCLEEGPDDSGAPLVRDCSCRGHSGFAHLPCLVKYAERRTKDMPGKGVFHATEMIEKKVFENCPNCKQAFQGDLRYDLTKAQLLFVEREFKDFPLRSFHLGALIQRIKALDGGNEADRVEGEELSAKMLSLVEDMKKKSDPSFDILELAIVYQVLGGFNCEVGTKCCLEKAKQYTEKARDIIITSGGALQPLLAIAAFESNIGKIEARLSGGRRNTLGPKRPTSKEVSSFRARYNYSLQLTGENDAVTIKTGVQLADVLFGAYHTIEAVRLLKTMVATSRRVHGSGHKETKDAVLLLQRMQMRHVYYYDVQPRAYQALRHENDGKKCVIQGPINKPRVTEKERTFIVPSTDIKVILGTPVVLLGLKKAAHLNGKVGDVRDYCQSTARYVVYLEDKGLKPVKVKHGNVHIVFDLSDPKNLD